MTHSYSITGMTCSSCVAHVKKVLLASPHIEAAEVQLQSPQATISMSQHIPLAELQETISKAGHYTISEYENAH